MALPQDDFRVENPALGFALVEVTQLDEQQVRVRIVGTETLPETAIEMTQQGLTLSAFESASDNIPLETIRILVTAEKTPADLQDVPISLTALSQAEIEDAQINSIRDVAVYTPNFFTSVGDRAFNFYSVRGLV